VINRACELKKIADYFVYDGAAAKTKFVNDCQARSENKLYFYFNCSLTAVSIAKADFFDNVENQQAPCSMKNITDYYSAKLFLDRILSKLDIDRHWFRMITTVSS